MRNIMSNDRKKSISLHYFGWLEDLWFPNCLLFLKNCSFLQVWIEHAQYAQSPQTKGRPVDRESAECGR